MTNTDNFYYPFRAYDMPDMSDETRDLMNVRDQSLEYYLSNRNRTWNSWTPTMRRGSTNVALSVTTATYTNSNDLVIVNCEAQITTSTSFPGNQILRFAIPVAADASTRILGHGMFQWAGVFYYCLAFIEGTAGGTEAVFIPHAGQPWLGQTLAGNPTISGTPTGNNFYMNLTYRQG